MVKNKYLLAFGVLLIGLFFNGCGEKNNSNGGMVNDNQKVIYQIGVIVPLSGEAAHIGYDIKKILDYHVEEVNKKTTDGIQWKLVYEDGKCDASSAISSFKKLSEKDSIRFIIGGICGVESLAIAPLLAEKNIIAISPLSSDSELETKSQNFFSLSYKKNLIEESLTDELGQFKKLAFISEKNIFSQVVEKMVEEKLKSTYPELEIVAKEEFEAEAGDLNNKLEKIKNSGAEVIFLNSTPGFSAEILLQKIAEIKDWNIKLVSHLAYNNPEMLKQFPKVAEGMTIIDAPEIASSSFTDYRNKIVTFNGSLDNLNNYYIAATLDSFDLLRNLITKYQRDTTKIQEALSHETFTGYLGNIYFGEKAFVKGLKASKFLVKNDEMEMIRNGM